MKKVYLWDFDGVLMNSNAVRDHGFKEVLKNYPKDQVDNLMQFHKKNGGLSRYVKFRYFFEDIRNEKISNDELLKWTDKFSNIMLELLIDSSLLINETYIFVTKNYNKVPMYIVSGSDQNELRFICKQMGIAKYFKGIYGSPVPKNELVRDLIDNNNYKNSDCVLIGDSINDFEAAELNNIGFIGYNNPKLDKLSNYSISFN